MRFRISSAGIAGDPDKLLIGEYEGGSVHTLFNSYGWFSLWSLRLAKTRLLREAEMKTGQRYREVV